MAVAMKSIRNLLYFLGLGSESSIVFLKIKVTNNVICILVIISQICFIVPYVLFAIDKHILLSHVDGPVYVILCIILMMFIYIDVIQNKVHLYETLNFLEEISTNGNYFVMIHEYFFKND